MEFSSSTITQPLEQAFSGVGGVRKEFIEFFYGTGAHEGAGYMGKKGMVYGAGKAISGKGPFPLSVVSGFVGGGIQRTSPTFMTHLRKAPGRFVHGAMLSLPMFGIFAALEAKETATDLSLLRKENSLGRIGIRTMSSFMGWEIGSRLGLLGGSALGTGLALTTGIGGLAAPVLTAVGYFAGGILGAEIGEEMAEIPFQLAEWGKRWNVARPKMVLNNSRIATMRQRSMQAIAQSEMNARSAFGNEADLYHMQ